jgi:hypothetical protein
MTAGNGRWPWTRTNGRTADLDGDWRRELRGKIFWLLLAKAVALFLLWFLFFRGGTP